MVCTDWWCAHERLDAPGSASRRRCRRRSAACCTPCAGAARRRSTDVAEMLDMTPSGARQHLTGLAEAGLLEVGEAARVPGQQGRTERTYCIAPAAEPLFPRAYGELTNQLLGYVPAGAVAEAFEHRRDDRIDEARARLAGKRSFAAKVDRAGEDPRRGRLPGLGRAVAGRGVPRRRAQLRHLRRRPRAPAGMLDRARVPARRAAGGRDRAGDPHDGRRPLVQLRGPPPPFLIRVFAAGLPRSKHSDGGKHSDQPRW